MEAVVPPYYTPDRRTLKPQRARGRSRPFLSPFDDRPVARQWLWLWSFVVTVAYAALWSRYWYPLSDSSLYMSLGRSWSLGRGLSMMGDPVRLVPPLTPMFLGTLMKFGLGIGGIQAVMIALMLVSFVLGFLTLRRWTNERLALAATLGTALSYWVFANAFTVMSEPLCVALMWGGFLALSYVSLHNRWRWALIAVACGLLLLSTMNRDAIFCLLPGPLLATLVKARRHKRWSKESFAWAATFFLCFGAWFFYRYPPNKLLAFFEPRVIVPPTVALNTTNPTSGPTTSTTGPTTGPTVAVAPPVNPETEGGDEGGGRMREGHYRAAWMQGVDRDYHMLTEPPMLGGRWVCEGLAMASVAIFETRNPFVKLFGYVVAVASFALAIYGGLNVFLRGRFWLLFSRFKTVPFAVRSRILRDRAAWWVVGAGMYFAIIWLQWGTRLKPRYMVPIAPLLVIFLWSGLTSLALRFFGGDREKPRDPRKVGAIVATTIVALVIVGNALPWAVEVYVRHGARRDFYDVARKAAYAQLVDIGDYAQKHIPGNESIVMTNMAHRRIAYFLTGHRLDIDQLDLKDWNEWDLTLEINKKEKFDQPILFRRRFTGPQRRRRFLSAIPKDARHIIVFAEHPNKQEWPGWHLPINENDTKTDWWRLYRREPDDTWTRVNVPRSRDYVKDIPGAAR
jgi:hypothetical protein